MTNREQMYLDYKLELCKLDGHKDLIDPVESYLEDVNFFQRAKGVHWIRILDKEKKEVGFLVALNKRRTEKGVDIRFLEVYVKPEYRRQGLAGKAVRRFIRLYDVDKPVVRFTILDNNEAAKKFWYSVYCYWPGDTNDVFVGPFPSNIEGASDYGYDFSLECYHDDDIDFDDLIEDVDDDIDDLEFYDDLIMEDD